MEYRYTKDINASLLNVYFECKLIIDEHLVKLVKVIYFSDSLNQVYLNFFRKQNEMMHSMTSTFPYRREALKTRPFQF